MSYLTGVADQRPLLRITAQVLVAFCCAARHDVYECCAFADCRCDIGADTVRLHSHPVIA